MSEHGHGGGGSSAKSESAFGSVSPAVWIFIAICLVIIMWQGYNVVSSSHEQHVWPSSDAAKVPLPASKI
jgi:hypothetical protein